MKKEKSCGAIIINDNKEVLLVQHNAGHWAFPKGHVEEGETEEKTAIREVKEETNVDIEVNSNYRYIITYSPKENVMKDVVFFVARPLSNELKRQEIEIKQIKYVPIEDVKNMLTHEDIKNIYLQAMEDLKKDNYLGD